MCVFVLSVDILAAIEVLQLPVSWSSVQDSAYMC